MLQNHINVFHLAWIMSLHYLVKVEMLVRQVLPLSCNRKKLQNTSHLNRGLQILQIWIRLITACEDCCKRRCKSTHPWSGRTETATENGVDQAGSCRHCGSHLSMASSRYSCRSVMSVLYTFSCNISHMLLWTGFTSSEFGHHSCRAINFGVSFGNN